MSHKLSPLDSYIPPNGPVLVVVVDGIGIAPAGPSNAVSLANTPNMDQLLAQPVSTPIFAHGTHVGLPSDSDMGNSEVGHNTLGGGRIFDQGAKLVENALNNGSLFNSTAWKNIETCAANGNTIHLLGLLSDGGVHSHIDHLFAMIDAAHAANFPRIRIHILLDGRDVAPRSAHIYLKPLEEKLAAINLDKAFDYRIASGGGRMAITMDRYEADWAMVERGYETHVHGIGIKTNNATDEIDRQYNNNPDINDQYLERFVIVDDTDEPIGRMADGDGVVMFNFRPDRAIEISQAIGDKSFNHFDRSDHPDVFFCGMLEYDGDLKIPTHYLVEPPKISDTIGEYLTKANIPLFAISETQKFGHVTFFWNGNRSGCFNEDLETYIEIPSDIIPFDKKPEMKAQEITDATIDRLLNSNDRYGRINLANGDMVGHSGDIDATIKAVETVDHCLGQLMQAIAQVNGIMIFVADHGNADEMFVEKEGQRIAKTSHTLNPVPFAIYDPQQQNSYRLSQSGPFGLANVAATTLNLLGYHAPTHYFPSIIQMES